MGSRLRAVTRKRYQGSFSVHAVTKNVTKARSRLRLVTQKPNEGSFSVRSITQNVTKAVSGNAWLHKNVTKVVSGYARLHKTVTKVGSRLHSVTEKRNQGQFPVTLGYTKT